MTNTKDARKVKLNDEYGYEIETYDSPKDMYDNLRCAGDDDFWWDIAILVQKAQNGEISLHDLNDHLYGFGYEVEFI